MGLGALWYKRSGPSLRGFQAPGGYPPAFVVFGGVMTRELSVFADESGADGLDSKYYLLTLVFHEQDVSLADVLLPYERALAEKRLPDIPFHASPLMNGHDLYAGLEARTRASLLSSFSLLFHHLPIRYVTFVYRKREFPNVEVLQARMRRDLVNYLYDHLSYFQKI